MLNSTLRQLASELGIDTITESLEQEITDKLDKKAKLDNVETVTFGLETDDGKIVKVYVNKEGADKFEQLMADALGSTDSIEDAINKAAAEVDIVDVEWPDPEDEEEEIEGSEALDPAVYSKKNKKEEVEAALKPREGGMKGFAQSAVAEAQGASNIGDRLTSANQQLVYQAIIDLGIPEEALSKSPYRANIIKGIRETALLLATAPQMKVALKQLVKHRIKAEAPKGKDHHKDHQVDEEQVIIESATTELYWSTFAQLLSMLDKDGRVSANFLELPKVRTLQAKSLTKLQRSITAQVRTKLQALGVALDAAKGKADTAETQVAEALSSSEVAASIGTLMTFAQPKGVELVEPVLTSTQGKQLLALVQRRAAMLPSQVRAKLEQLLAAIAAVPIAEAKGDEGYQLGNCSFDEGQAEKAKKALDNRVTTTLVALDGARVVLSPRKPTSFVKHTGTGEKSDITQEQIDALSAAFTD